MPPLAAILQPEQELERCQRQLQADNQKQKLEAIATLGAFKDRRAYSILLEGVKNEMEKGEKHNEEAIAYAISSFASMDDSRALFPVINLFRTSHRPLIQQRALQYLYHTADPRAEEFIQDYLQQEDVHFKDIARNAFSRCAGYSDFRYRFAGSYEEWQQASSPQKECQRVRVVNAELNCIEEILREYAEGEFRRPQTYIVDEGGIMYIGVHLHEHVQVAQGSDVRAAGEITFSKTSEDRWEVDTLNHRSCGYFPALSSLSWVWQYFERNSDVSFAKKDFEERFPREGYNDSEFLSLFPFA